MLGQLEKKLEPKGGLQSIEVGKLVGNKNLKIIKI
jgi:hypothetical protein